MSSVDGYCLARNYAASARLNFQHYVWKDAVGYNINPKIPIRDENDFTIADVGTGTGIWLTDVNRQLPSARLDGFDISADQYPPKEWLPKNVSLSTLDIHKDIPGELKGRYDIVHVRLLLTVVKNDDPLPILKNLMDMLKPGGFLQWSEHNIATMKVVTARPEANASKVEFLVNQAKAAVRHKWVSQLPDSFIKQGFKDVSVDHHSPRDEVQIYFTQIQCMVAEEHSIITMDNSDLQSGGPAVRRRIQEASQAMREGASLHFVPEVTVGRKPE